MERRPHWDRELEQAVSAILFDCYENGVSEAQVYQVIAAVEDWQNNEHEAAMKELREWQAVIQRVRDVYYSPVGLLDTRIRQIGEILDGGAE